MENSSSAKLDYQIGNRIAEARLLDSATSQHYFWRSGQAECVVGNGCAPQPPPQNTTAPLWCNHVWHLAVVWQLHYPELFTAWSLLLSIKVPGNIKSERYISLMAINKRGIHLLTFSCSSVSDEMNPPNTAETATWSKLVEGTMNADVSCITLIAQSVFKDSLSFSFH